MSIRDSIPEPLHEFTRRPLRWPVSTGQPDGSKSPGDSVGIHAFPIIVNNNAQIAKKPGTLPPHPTIAQQLTALPLSLQFSFNQVTSPTPYGNTIDSYRVYRNASANNFSGATLVRTFKHDPTHQGPITVQDNTGAGKTYYYFVTTVDTTAQESVAVAASPGAVVVTSQAANPTIGQAVGVTSNPSTSSTSYATLTDMTLTKTVKGGPILLLFTTILVSSNLSVSSGAFFAFFRDGVQISTDFLINILTISAGVQEEPLCHISYLDSGESVGSHTYDVRWKSVGTASNPIAVGIQRSFQLVELG